MTSWHSYPKLYALGHCAIRDIFKNDVVIEEKIDGSQFSFGVYSGELCVRSKGVQIYFDNIPKMFAKGVAAVQSLHERGLLKEGWMYTGEYLEKPKHNVIAYDRIPADHIILFDVRIEEETYLSHEEKTAEGLRLGLEVVPQLASGKFNSLLEVQKFLDNKSILGDVPIEGVVIKNYHQFGEDKKALLAKVVSAEFKEDHRKVWKSAFPKSGDFVESLGAVYRHENRWKKAIQHLKEANQLENSPRDIGPLLKEIQNDIEKECQDEIMRELWKYAWPKIARHTIRGFPEWYKDQLAATQEFN